MASINSNTAVTKLQLSLDSANSSANVQDLFMLSLAVDKNSSDREFYVNTSNDLPNIVSANVPEGQIYFVDNLKVLVMSANNQWMGLDGRVLRTDGGEISDSARIWSWGGSVCGVLGDGTTLCKSSPVSVIGGFTDWCQISAGDLSTAAIRTNGTLWSWGFNSLGRLGDGTTVNKCSPVSVVGGFTDWCQVSSGFGHTAAVRRNGTLWTWGSGGGGRLGNNSITDRSSPVSVVGAITDWCQVAAGNIHTAAVRENGTLWAWGCNTVSVPFFGLCTTGLLGNSNVCDSSSPVSVVGGFTDWCQVSTGMCHNVALRTNGTLWSWGEGTCGKLGNGTTVDRFSPVPVVGGFTDWCQVSSTRNHTVAVRQNGTVWAWGCGSDGRLGNNSIAHRCSPVSVIGGFTDWCQVSAGHYHTVAVRTNGTVWTWGLGECGRMGNSSISDRSSPVCIAGGLTNWCQVSAGDFQTAAIQRLTNNC